MKKLSFLLVLVLGVTTFAKDNARKVASADEGQMVSRMIEQISAFPKNKITFKQKFKVLAEFTKCEKLPETYMNAVENKMTSEFKSGGGYGVISLAKNFGVLKCNSNDGAKLFTLVRMENVFSVPGSEPMENALMLSTAEYSANLDEIDYDDLLGSDAMWLFASSMKTNKSPRYKSKVTQNAIKNARFEDFLSEKANIYFK